MFFGVDHKGPSPHRTRPTQDQDHRQDQAQTTRLTGPSRPRGPGSHRSRPEEEQPAPTCRPEPYSSNPPKCETFVKKQFSKSTPAKIEENLGNCTKNGLAEDPQPHPNRIRATPKTRNIRKKRNLAEPQKKGPRSLEIFTNTYPDEIPGEGPRRRPAHLLVGRRSHCHQQHVSAKMAGARFTDRHWLAANTN